MDRPSAFPARPAVPVPAALALPQGAEVQVWWTDIDVPAAAVGELRALLDASTRARVDAMVREPDRRRTILAHGLLRRLVAAGTGQDPAAVAIVRHCLTCDATDHGKPVLAGAAPLSFNLAHSGDVVAVALSSAGVEVGVDVEAITSPFDWAPVRRHVFTDAEWAASDAAADPSAERFALWARKEASAKATGHGLSIDLAKVAVEGHPEASGARRGRLTAPESVHDLLVADVDLQAGTAAAVAIAATAGVGAPAVTVSRVGL